MFRAKDINGNSIFIDDAIKNNKYFCPACEQPLILKIYGTKKRHYFSHFANTVCKDDWKPEPMSEWHTHWQNWFNKENREVWIKNEHETHRADVAIDNTIIEFQHSFISNTDFNKRNKFYTNCNKYVVWIFDMKKQVSLNADGTFNWKKGSKFESTFVDFENYNNRVTVFFEVEKQVNNSISKILIPITNFYKKQYFKFKTFDYDIIDLNFLKNYIELPDHDDLSLNELLDWDREQQKTILYRTFPNKNKYITRRGPKEWGLHNNRKKIW